jgi:subtilisin family serine protease
MKERSGVIKLIVQDKNMKYLKEKFLIFIFILGSIIFWLWILKPLFNSASSNSYSNISQNNNFNYIVIDDSMIEEDSITNRKLVSNLINIALKDQKGDILQFLDSFNQVYSNQFTINFIDTTINRTQITITNSNDRDSLKKEIKTRFASFQPLVWDEAIFARNSKFNDPIRLDQKVNWHFDAINIESLWQATKPNHNVIVAVIDNGFDLNHKDLKDKIIVPYNIPNKNNSNFSNQINHGTHVASIIAATANNYGTVGIAPNAKIMPIKAEDDNGYITSSYIIDGILYAIKNKANVINLSLGIQFPNNNIISEEAQQTIIENQYKDEEIFWKELFEYANKNNVICVLAAGNSSLLTGLDPMQRDPNTIKVGAYDKNQQIAPFSNYGKWTTIYAPGDEVIGAKPNNQFESLSGTSMAAPIIAGVAALLKGQDTGYNAQNFQVFLNKNHINKNNFKQFKFQKL